MAENNSWLPLFPLNAVLFPGGMLSLRVFEARYVDMVSECLKRNAPFGVVLIKSGNEVGAVAEPETVGCIAHIEHTDMNDPGILSITVRGGERFRTLETRELPGHRLEARIEKIPADAAAPLNEMHIRCAKALKAVIDDINAKARGTADSPLKGRFASMALDNTGWVANRWCEILPIPLKARQKLLELESARSRLEIVYRYLQQHAIL